jgi:mersacidin/lichenicidin family type 2 lantibiotic
MTPENIIRAWKDPIYRNSLSESERTAMPAHPAGSIEVSDEDLGKIGAGYIPRSFISCATVSFIVMCQI